MKVMKKQLVSHRNQILHVMRRSLILGGWTTTVGWNMTVRRGCYVNCVSALGNSPLLLLDARTSKLRRSQDMLREVSTEMRYWLLTCRQNSNEPWQEHSSIKRKLSLQHRKQPIGLQKKMWPWENLVHWWTCYVKLVAQTLTNWTVVKMRSTCQTKQLKNSRMLVLVFGLGSDGASVMTGHKGGVCALMKKENPMLVNVHCLTHWLALCTSQAASDIAKLRNYQQIFTDIYYYFNKSAKRSQGLKKVQEVLESDVLKIKGVHSCVHWFSFYNALYAIYHSWGTLVTYFASHAESDAKAKGFLKITEY